MITWKQTVDRGFRIVEACMLGTIIDHNDQCLASVLIVNTPM